MPCYIAPSILLYLTIFYHIAIMTCHISYMYCQIFHHVASYISPRLLYISPVRVTHPMQFYTFITIPHVPHLLYISRHPTSYHALSYMSPCPIIYSHMLTLIEPVVLYVIVNLRGYTHTSYLYIFLHALPILYVHKFRC